MNIKEYSKRVLFDVINIKLFSNDFWLFAALAFVFCLATTPILGIPISAVIISERIQKRQKNIS